MERKKKWKKRKKKTKNTGRIRRERISSCLCMCAFLCPTHVIIWVFFFCWCVDLVHLCVLSSGGYIEPTPLAIFFLFLIRTFFSGPIEQKWKCIKTWKRFDFYFLFFFYWEPKNEIEHNKMFWRLFSFFACIAVSDANQQHSLVEPGGRPFSSRLPRPRRRDARIFWLSRQSLIRYVIIIIILFSCFIHDGLPFPHLFPSLLLFIFLSCLNFMYLTYKILFFLHFNGTTAPEDWRELRNNKSDTHSHELTELHLADWVSNSTSLLFSLI